MNPIAFNIFGLDIRWYGILIATGLIVGITLANFTCRLKKFDYDEFLNIVLISFPIAIIGARAYYVIFEFSQYKDNLLYDLIYAKVGLLTWPDYIRDDNSIHIYKI